MKYALVVLRNTQNPVSSVEFEPVVDAFLSGGVFLDEVLLLPYDKPSLVSEHLFRLSKETEGLFIVCDGAIKASAQEAISLISGENSAVCETEKCLFAVIFAGKSGAESVAADLIPRIDRRRNRRYSRVVIGTVAAPAKKIRDALRAAEEVAEDKLLLHAGGKYGVNTIEIIYDQETPKMTADEAVRAILGEVGEYTYTIGGESIAERLVEALKLHRLKISTAESFTGGGVGGAIVAVSGASSVFYEGINAYDSDAKIDRLGVKEYTVRSKGAVTDETAYEMAAGLIAQGHCDISIATTGVAGPNGDGTNAPVGLVYIAVGTKEHVRVYRYDLTGDRETVTKTAINLALFLAYRELK